MSRSRNQMYCDETVAQAVTKGYDSWNEAGAEAVSPYRGSVLLDWAWSEGWIASSRGEGLSQVQARVKDRDMRIM